MNTLLLDALQCRNYSGRPPVWLMRQAGRYMPEYRAIREKYSFLEMCHTPEIATEVTLQPIRAFGMDAAILFSDILVIPEALGVGLHFKELQGPIIERPLSNVADVDQLPRPDISESLGYVEKAIRLLKPELAVPLIGFSGAPFTVASYMIEGKTSRDLVKTKRWMLRDPESFHRLLDRIAEETIAYLNLQIDAGVDALQIFDSWANVLSFPAFREFSLAYFEKILKGLKNPDIPVIVFCRGSSVFAKDLASISPGGISIDWNGEMAQLRQVIPQNIALQGNLDPSTLYASEQTIRQEVRKMLNTMHGDPGYIFNLGHGVCPDMPVSAVKALVDEVQSA